MSKHQLKLVTIIGLSGLLIIAAALFFAFTSMTPSVAQAQQAAEAAPLPRTITVVGEGKSNIEPDMATVMIGVQVMGPEAQAASVEAQETMNQVLDAIKAQGIAAEDIQTSGFNIFASPSYGPDGQVTNEVTYQVSNNVNVKIRDLEKVGPVLDASIEAGANNIYGVNFTLEDFSQPEAEARSEAVASARAKAEDIATLAGAQLGDIVSVSEVIGNQGGFFSPEARASMQGLGGGPIEPGQLEVQVQLQVVYNLQ